jgi:hypothetical protein
MEERDVFDSLHDTEHILKKVEVTRSRIAAPAKVHPWVVIMCGTECTVQAGGKANRISNGGGKLW